MPWATGDNVIQVRGLCTTKQDAMGPARVNCHAMGHRRQCSSVRAVQSKTRRKTHNTDTHLVPLVDALEPLQGKSKTFPLIQGTRPPPPLVPHGHTARMWARGAVWET
jgi:hypothetical protein